MSACLPLSQVHLWYYLWDGAPDPAWLEALCPILSSQERDRYRRFSFDRDRQAYLLAHVLLRRVLSRYCDISESAWEFATGSHGKPFIATPGCEDLHFSLTHSEGLVACAVRSHAEVGVDAERIDRQCAFLEIARSTFAPAEVLNLESSPPEARRQLFFSYWTLKEAYVKALGLGLSASLKDFSIELGIGSCEARGSDPSWRLQLHHPAPNYVMATAFRMADTPELSVYNAAALLQDPSGNIV